MYNCSLIDTQDREVVLLTLPYVFENLLEEIVILVCKFNKDVKVEFLWTVCVNCLLFTGLS